jgi:ABC-type lipoprotein release transport system permease subunit
MLMSVTDRLNEIATMKCLGAVDGFIMALFVFEAMVQGLIGSVVGVSLGIALSLIRAGAGFGFLVFESMRVSDIFLAGGISFFAGILIAALAATWPSWAAARLAPMEAMRVE